MRARTLALVAVPLLAVGVGVGLLVKQRHFPPAVTRLVYRVELERGGPPAEKLARMLHGVRRRAEGLCRGVAVRRRGETIEVDLPRLSSRALQTFKRRITERVRFELRRVDDVGSPVPRMIAAVPLPESIRIKRNDYEAPGRGTVRYVTLVSPNRRELERYLERAPAGVRPGPGRELVLGEGWGDHGREVLYELYNVHRDAALNGSHVALAEAFRDEATGRHEVSVTLTPEGARRFEQVTRDAVGHRLAIMLDGSVSSAPVVQAPITGGRARISLGGYKDLTTQRLEAEALAGALEAGALPGKLELVRTEKLR